MRVLSAAGYPYQLRGSYRMSYTGTTTNLVGSGAVFAMAWTEEMIGALITFARITYVQNGAVPATRYGALTFHHTGGTVSFGSTPFWLGLGWTKLRTGFPATVTSGLSSFMEQNGSLLSAAGSAVPLANGYLRFTASQRIRSLSYEMGVADYPVVLRGPSALVFGALQDGTGLYRTHYDIAWSEVVFKDIAGE
jgi:hypothetical protein